MRRIIDISQALSPDIAVWPGDTPFEAFWTATLADTGSVNVGGVTMSLHTGTHADAPKHFRDDGGSPADIDLTPYLGPADVIDLSNLGAEALCHGITADHIRPHIAKWSQRVLFRTNTATDPTEFPQRFAFFTVEAAELLAESRVLMVGIDSPSVDAVDSKDLGAHHVFADNGIAILENLVLEHVSAGRYELIALPLKIVGMDASPVRAVLVRPD
jgi:arylformamidase